MGRLAKLSAGILAIAWFSSRAVAALPGYEPALRPEPPGGGPTPIAIGVYFLDIDEVDDRNQRFDVDMLVTLRWHDSGLAVGGAQAGPATRLMPMSAIWRPRLLVINDRGLVSEFEDMAEVSADGEVTYRQRLHGQLAADLHYEQFPFDTQTLPIRVVSYRYGADELLFSPDSSITGNDGSFSAEGWRFRLGEARNATYDLPGGNEQRPQLTFTVEAKRNSRYYVLTVLVPMGLIALMAWAVFWLPAEIVPSRVAISTASIFSLIAFGFSTRLSLPPVSYMTRTDKFMLGSTVLVFAALAIVIVGSRWANAGENARTQRLNRIARRLYPLLLAICAAYSLLT